MDYYVYLNLERYLAEWYIHESGGSPVVLKKGSAESDVLECFLQKLPADKMPDTGKESNVTIKIPCFKYKDPRTYNYLPPLAKKALERTIYIRFRVQMWNELYKLDNTECCITDLIYAWMEKHGITPDEKNWENIRQMYLRKRNSYRKCKKIATTCNTE